MISLPKNDEIENEDANMGGYSLMPDPLSDRAITYLPQPPNLPLEDDVLFGNKNDLPNWKLVKKFLKDEGKLSKQQAMKISKMSIDILKKEPNLMKIAEPVCVVGDVHG